MHEKKVLVAGCGGLGGYNVELLARLGVGSITVCDGDTFDESNMNRQLFCTADTIGTEKPMAAYRKWPDQVIPVCFNIDETNADSLVDGCDLVVDSLDSAPSRKLVLDACSRHGIPFVHGAIGDTNCQVCAIFPGDGDILDILYPEGGARKIRTFSYSPAMCASMQISLAHRILKGEDVERRCLYIFDLDQMDFEVLHL